MASRKEIISPQRGEVYLVSFDPTLGAEIKKTRPAVVLQNDIANRYSPITIVAVISSQFGPRLYPTEVFIQPPEVGLRTESVAVLNQIHSIDKRRLVKKLGQLSGVTLTRINKSLQLSLGLVDF